MINNALATGLQGVQQGTLNMQDAANRIARNGVVESPAPGGETGGGQQVRSETGGLAESIVDLKVSQRGVEASLAVVETADETLGTLLDEQA